MAKSKNMILQYLLYFILNLQIHIALPEASRKYLLLLDIINRFVQENHNNNIKQQQKSRKTLRTRGLKYE